LAAFGFGRSAPHTARESQPARDTYTAQIQASRPAKTSSREPLCVDFKPSPAAMLFFALCAAAATALDGSSGYLNTLRPAMPPATKPTAAAPVVHARAAPVVHARAAPRGRAPTFSSGDLYRGIVSYDPKKELALARKDLLNEFPRTTANVKELLEFPRTLAKEDLLNEFPRTAALAANATKLASTARRETAQKLTTARRETVMKLARVKGLRPTKVLRVVRAKKPAPSRPAGAEASAVAALLLVSGTACSIPAVAAVLGRASLLASLLLYVVAAVRPAATPQRVRSVGAALLNARA